MIPNLFLIIVAAFLAICNISGSFYLSKTLVHSFHISQGSVATHLMYGGILNTSLIAKFSYSVRVKKFDRYFAKK